MSLFIVEVVEVEEGNHSSKIFEKGLFTNFKEIFCELFVEIFAGLIFFNDRDETHIFEYFIDLWAVSIAMSCAAFHLIHDFFDISEIAE